MLQHQKNLGKENRGKVEKKTRNQQRTGMLDFEWRKANRS